MIKKIGFTILTLVFLFTVVFAGTQVIREYRESKYIIECFLCHLKQFVALSSGNHILFEPRVSTVPMCSENDCGMVCGRKNTPRTKKIARGVCCWWYVNS